MIISIEGIGFFAPFTWLVAILTPYLQCFFLFKNHTMTLLKRLGNKSKIAKEIQAYFPPHKTYIDVCFGAGGMFFNKPKAQYNIVNDLDSDVFNLFQVVMNQKEELKEAFYAMPIHNDLFQYWRNNKETDPIKKALRFLFLSNFSYLGKMDTLRFGQANPKKVFNSQIDKTNEMLYEVQFNNCNFKDFLQNIAWRKEKEKEKGFVYADPPYLGTSDNYSSSFKEQDSSDLFDALQTTGIKWAMSEFNHPFIIQQAKDRGLNIIKIGERRNIKDRRTEILVTNYKNNQLKLF